VSPNSKTTIAKPLPKITVSLVNAKGQCGEATVPGEVKTQAAAYLKANGYSAAQVITCAAQGYTVAVAGTAGTVTVAKAVAGKDLVIKLYTKPLPVYWRTLSADKKTCGESAIPSSYTVSALKFAASKKLSLTGGKCSEIGYTVKLGSQPLAGSKAPTQIVITTFKQPLPIAVLLTSKATVSEYVLVAGSAAQKTFKTGFKNGVVTSVNAALAGKVQISASEVKIIAITKARRRLLADVQASVVYTVAVAPSLVGDVQANKAALQAAGSSVAASVSSSSEMKNAAAASKPPPPPPTAKLASANTDGAADNTTTYVIGAVVAVGMVVAGFVVSQQGEGKDTQSVQMDTV